MYFSITSFVYLQCQLFSERICSKIYNICLEIDNILENEEYKEIYYYVLLQNHYFI